MIQQQTILKVADNSGAKTAKCIKILGGYKKRYAKLGDIIVVSIQQLRNKAKISSKVNKGDIYKALVLKTKKSFDVKDGSSMIFQENTISLINKQNKLLGTRIVGPLPKLLKKGKFNKFTSISSGFV